MAKTIREVQSELEVSVCVITYNQEKHIRKCLQSIVDQKTDFNFEILVGDDSSTDGTTEIVKEFQLKYPKLFKLILHNKNLGSCDNFRAVHFAASGRYVAHIDGDDWWHQGKLQAQFIFMQNNQNCSVVYTNAWVESAAGEVLGIFSNGVEEFFDLPYLIKSGNFLTTSSTFYRKKFRELAIPLTGEFVDFLVHIRLAQLGTLGFIDRNFVSYTHQSATSMIKADNNKVRLLILEAIKDLKLNELLIAKNRAMIYFVADTMVHAIRHFNYDQVRAWYILANDCHSSTIHFLNFRLIYWMLVIMVKRVAHRLLNAIRKSDEFFIFYRK
jgi:glycosyltransferase involved in cell wall biosynthesis